MELAKAYYILTLSNFFSISKEFIKSHIIDRTFTENNTPYRFTSKVNVSIKGKLNAKEKLIHFLTKLNIEKLWLYIDSSHEFGPLEVTPRFIIENLDKLMNIKSGYFTIQSPKKMDNFYIEFEQVINEKSKVDDYRILIEIQGNVFNSFSKVLEGQ